MNRTRRNNCGPSSWLTLNKQTSFSPQSFGSLDSSSHIKSVRPLHVEDHGTQAPFIHWNCLEQDWSVGTKQNATICVITTLYETCSACLTCLPAGK